MKRLSVLFIAIASPIIFTSCGSRSVSDGTKSENGIVTNYTQCVLPESQGEGSFKGRWERLPISLVLDKDFYLADSGRQANAIKSAIDTWNTWSALRGFSIFQVVNDGNGVTAGRYIPQFDDSQGCEPSLFTNSATDGVVGIWKIRSGGDGRNKRGTGSNECDILPTGFQALTDWVVSDGAISRASILVNFDKYNAPGKEKLDLESLILHELGHVVGLLHSCVFDRDTDASSSPLCSAAPSKFLDAVMYPSLRSSQIRRKLMPNDLDRVNCIY